MSAFGRHSLFDQGLGLIGHSADPSTQIRVLLICGSSPEGLINKNAGGLINGVCKCADYQEGQCILRW